MASAPQALASDRKEITIVSHSMLFYWWPVWAVGLLMALLSYIDGHRVALVPENTEALEKADVAVGEAGKSTKYEGRQVLLVPKEGGLPKDAEGKDLAQPKLRMTARSSWGVLFATVLLLVIFITNVPLRGLWSVVVIILVVLLAVIFALAGWWETIFHYASLLDIRINVGGYLFISLILFAMWLVVMLLFDRQIYMVFTPGQFRVCQEVGGGESTYDTMGMVIQKQRDDLFRHIILGLGSGDLIVRTSGANTHEFHMPNVLFIGRKLQQIEDMQRDRPMVKGSV
jgi:hypothetical protein